MLTKTADHGKRYTESEAKAYFIKHMKFRLSDHHDFSLYGRSVYELILHNADVVTKALEMEKKHARK